MLSYETNYMIVKPLDQSLFRNKYDATYNEEALLFQYEIYKVIKTCCNTTSASQVLSFTLPAGPLRIHHFSEGNTLEKVRDTDVSTQTLLIM